MEAFGNRAGAHDTRQTFTLTFRYRVVYLDPYLRNDFGDFPWLGLHDFRRFPRHSLNREPFQIRINAHGRDNTCGQTQGT